jgi:hypothetical protein
VSVANLVRLEELRQVLIDFKGIYNENRIIQRLGDTDKIGAGPGRASPSTKFWKGEVIKLFMC